MSDERLAILHTESSLGWGGQEIRILTEARAMARLGHAVVIAAPREARIFTEASAYGVEAVAVPIARKGLRGITAMKQLLAARRFDVVNTHSSTDSWLVALAGSPTPIVRTRHISAPVPRNFATRWLYGKAALVVTTGTKLRRQVIEETGVDGTRVRSIPTGIDLDHFSPGDRAEARRAVGLPADVPIVGIVATLRSWKGHGHLFDALKLARTAELLVVVGDGPMRQALENYRRDQGLVERVRFAGDRKDVVPWLRAFDVFCLPSYANEGVPQALMQAMACGLPVVSTPVGSIEELVEDGRTGLLVPPSDPPALARAIDTLIGNRAFAAGLGAAALEHARARFGEKRMVDAMLEVFSDARQASA